MELKHLNTLALDCVVAQFIEVFSSAALVHALEEFAQTDATPFVLGEGSNIVLRSAEIAACLKVSNKGVKRVTEDSHTVTLDVAAGENWNELVNASLEAGYYGLENLALIPGTVGAAPVQNIGAYGVELSEFVEQVVFRDLATGQAHTYSSERCEFSYRESVFKNKLRDVTVIETVRLKLRKEPRINRSYEALAKATQHLNCPSPLDVRDAVVEMRSSKLPDPQTLANAGSFFKNPVVSAEQFESLRERHEDLVFYVSDDGQRFKLAAAWLIDQAGWKGRYEGDFGMHQQQALVLVNRGGNSGQKLLEFAEKVRQSVFEKFAVRLVIEPRIY